MEKGKEAMPTDLFRRGYSRWIIRITFIIFIIFSFLDISLFEEFWPYIILAGGIILLDIFWNDKTARSLLMIIIITSAFGLQFFYYTFLPKYYNYAPITLPLAAGFNMGGKFTVNYVPDFPKQGDQIILQIKVCDVGLKKCSICTECNLSGFVNDELNQTIAIFSNKSMLDGPIEFSFPGKYVNVMMNYKNETYMNSFIIPKQNFYQTLYISFLESPIYAIIEMVSVILTIALVFYGAWKGISKIRKRENVSRRVKDIKKTKFSNKAKLLIFIYLSVSFVLLSYAAISLAFKGILSITIVLLSIFIGALIGIVIEVFVIERSDLIRIWYDSFIERLNSNLTNKVKMDLERYSKIEDESVRNIMIKAYVEDVFGKSNSNIWTKVLTMINLLIIGFNLMFILITSFISNSNPIFALLFQEKIEEIGVVNVSQELGIDYAHLSQVYSQNNFGLYLQMISALPSLIWSSFIIVFYGFIIYFILESAKNARNKAINETIIELYS
jgi:hypothetical protein